eukprot:1456271-Alexandrium_andersonii.AAC.1
MQGTSRSIVVETHRSHTCTHKAGNMQERGGAQAGNRSEPGRKHAGNRQETSGAQAGSKQEPGRKPAGHKQETSGEPTEIRSGTCRNTCKEQAGASLRRRT